MNLRRVYTNIDLVYTWCTPRMWPVQLWFPTCSRSARECPFYFYLLQETNQFTWDPQHEALVKGKWQEMVRVRLKDMVNKAANEPPHKIISWTTDDVRTSLKHKRKTDEEFKKRCEWNRRNKIEGSKAKIGHNRG